MTIKDTWTVPLINEKISMEIQYQKYEKRSYRTIQGLWSALMHKKDGWIKRRNEDLTNII